MRRFIPLLAIMGVLGCNSTTPSTPAAPGAPAAQTTPTAAPSATASVFVPDNSGNALDHAEVPRYPGSTVIGTASTPGEAGQVRFSVLATTTDSADKVVKFYKDKLTVVSGNRDGVTKFVWRTKQGADIILDIASDGKSTKMSYKGIIYK